MPATHEQKKETIVNKRREAILVRISSDEDAIIEWKRHAARLLEASIQMRGYRRASRIEWRIAHGKDSLIEASCEVERVADQPEWIAPAPSTPPTLTSPTPDLVAPHV